MGMFWAGHWHVRILGWAWAYVGPGIKSLASQFVLGPTSEVCRVAMDGGNRTRNQRLAVDLVWLASWYLVVKVFGHWLCRVAMDGGNRTRNQRLAVDLVWLASWYLVVKVFGHWLCRVAMDGGNRTRNQRLAVDLVWLASWYLVVKVAFNAYLADAYLPCRLLL